MGRAVAWVSLLSATLLVTTAAGQDRPQASPDQLVRQVIGHEVQAEQHDNSYWMFRLHQTQSGTTKTEEVVETPHGWVRRLLAINDKPLSEEERAKDDAHLHKLLTDRGEQRKNQEATRNDVRQAQELLQMLPDAFLYASAGRSGDAVKLNFRPNPKFHPKSRQAAVFHDMVGSLWLDVRQQRLAAIQGRLNQKVKFAGGLLGHLDKGGTFDVKQTQIAPGIWDVTYMNVQMNGKALFFKTIAVREKDIRSDYRRVSSNLTLAEAAKLIKRGTNTLTAKR